MKSILKIFLLNLFFATSLLAQQEEFGLASYYSDLFHGKPTASGELYDKGKLTCAHKTLPFGTVLKVTRLDNNQSVEVKVNDRGPFISGRVVEVSKGAAEKLGLVKDGSAKVKVEVAKPGKPAEATANNKVEELPKSAETPVAIEKKEAKPTEPQKEPVAEKSKSGNESKAATKPAAEAKAPPKAATANAPAKPNAPVNQKPVADKKETADKGAPAKQEPPKAVKIKGSDYQANDLFQLELKRPDKKGFGVQVAVLSSQDALFKKVAELQENWFDNILVNVQSGPKGEMQYKVLLGAFATEAEANSYKSSLKKKKMDGFVVDLASLGK